ncbi:MAG: hypothetical protein H6841_06175 [Planctomycetes bacterium]|nr:hypothetical protein [Planctomycetota bacterium]
MNRAGSNSISAMMQVNGLVRCVHPGIDNHVSFGTVLNVDYDAGLMQSYMDVEDLEGRVLNAETPMPSLPDR